MTNLDAIIPLLYTFFSVFFFFGLGFLIQRIRPLDEKTIKQLFDLLIYFLLPIYIFYATATGITLEDLKVAPVIIIAAVILTMLSWGIAKVIERFSNVKPAQKTPFVVTTMIPNTGFLGIPVIQALLGTTGIVYGILYDFGTGIILMTFCVWLYKGGKVENIASLFLNPLLISAVLGLGWVMTGWSFPTILSTPLDAFGQGIMPLVLIVVGIQIGSIRSKIGDWLKQLSIVIVARLVIIPAIIIGLFFLFGWHDLTAKVIMLQIAMPVAVFTSVFAHAYDSDYEFASSAVLWSTLISIITLPIIALIVL